MNFKVIYYCLLLFVISNYQLAAQQIPYHNKTNNNQNQPKVQDVVYLKNGSIIKGKIIEKNAENVKIEILGGSIFVFTVAEVQDMKQEAAVASIQIKPAKKYHFQDTGFYNHFQFKLNSTVRGSSVSGGVGLSYSFGYLFGYRKYFGLQNLSCFSRSKRLFLQKKIKCFLL